MNKHLSDFLMVLVARDVARGIPELNSYRRWYEYTAEDLTVYAENLISGAFTGGF